MATQLELLRQCAKDAAHAAHAAAHGNPHRLTLDRAVEFAEKTLRGLGAEAAKTLESRQTTEGQRHAWSTSEAAWEARSIVAGMARAIRYAGDNADVDTEIAQEMNRSGGPRPTLNGALWRQSLARRLEAVMDEVSPERPSRPRRTDPLRSVWAPPRCETCGFASCDC